MFFRRTPVIVLLFFVLGVGATLGQTSPRPPDQLRVLSREELDVVKVLTMQERAWNKGDIEGYAGGYKNSPDTLFVANTVNRGYNDILQDYKRNYPNKEAMGSLTFSDLEPHVLSPQYAVLIGRYRLERGKKVGGPAEGTFTMVLEKTDAGWKIVLSHTT